MKGARADNRFSPVGSTNRAGRALSVPLLCLSLLGLSSPLARAASEIRFSGQLGGTVTDHGGKPQTGAVVLLFNAQARLLQRSTTDALGRFGFADLLPDLYSVRVSLSAFVPAVKERIQIKPGMRSLLEVNLSRVFSSVQLVSTTPVPGSLMSDSWKWVLRADSSTRPILRLLPVQPPPQQPASDPAASETASAPLAAARQPIFTDSRGMLKLSANDGPTITGDGQADLGTQFAFETSVYGVNHVQLAGNVGYTAAGSIPSAAIRTTVSRELSTGDSPDISVTMRQVYLPWHSTQGDSAQPALRTLGVSFEDHKQIDDALSMQYGFEFDNVSLLDTMDYFSPYAKLTRAIPHGQVDFAWTAGNPRPELGLGSDDPSNDLQRDLTAVGMLPRVAEMDGHSAVQMGSDFELGASQRFGSREFRVSAYQENVANTTLTVGSTATGLFPGDLTPDLMSNSSLFDMGRFNTAGYTVSMTQDLGDNLHLSVIYGSLGMFTPQASDATLVTADDLRKMMDVSQRPGLTLRVSGTIKATGSHFMASYQWTDYQSAIPGPSFSTDPNHPEPGLNIVFRQPMPAIPRVPWRMEASAELRNLLAQGYLPMRTAGGDQFLLIDTPRCIRGGIAFVF